MHEKNGLSNNDRSLDQSELDRLRLNKAHTIRLTEDDYSQLQEEAHRESMAIGRIVSVGELMRRYVLAGLQAAS